MGTDVLIHFGADTAGAQAGISGFQTGFASTMALVGSSVAQIGAQITAMAGQIDAAFGSTIDTFASYDQAMANTRSITQGSSQDFEKMDALAVELASTMPTTSKAIADGFFQLASAGLNANEIMTVTPGIMNLAAASGNDFKVTADAMTAALATYGLEMEDTNAVAEIFQNTNKGFKTTLPELATSLAFAGSSAAVMGISLEDTAAAIGLARNAGLDASTAGTGLRTVLLSLASPTDQAAEAMAAIGFELQRAADGSLDMEATFTDLKVAMENIQDPIERAAFLQEVFGKRGISVANALAQNSEGLNALADSLTEEGAVAEAVAIQNEGLANQMKILSGEIEEQQKALGEKLAPAQLKVMELQVQMLGLLNKLPDGMVKWGGGALFVAAGLAKMVLPLVSTVLQIGLLIVALKGRTVATAAATTATTADTVATTGYTIAQWAANIAMYAFPAFLIVAGIVAIIAAIVLVVKNWDTLTGWFNKSFKAIKDNIKVLSILLAILFPFIGIPIAIIANWEKISAFFTGLWDRIIGGLKSMVTFFRNAFSNLANNAVQWGRDIVSNLINGLLDAIGLGRLGGAADEVIDAFTSGLGFKSPTNPEMQSRGRGMVSQVGVGAKEAAGVTGGALGNLLDPGRGSPAGGPAGVGSMVLNFGDIILSPGSTRDEAQELVDTIRRSFNRSDVGDFRRN